MDLTKEHVSFDAARPGPKKRRPALSCLQCYQRKLKCGRELPACSRCAKSGHECTYRGSTSYQTPSNNPKLRSRRSGNVVCGGTANNGLVKQAALTDHMDPLSPDETRIRHTASAVGEVSHFKGQDTSIKFYGYSYHLNFYQQFTDLRPYIAQLKAGNPAINKLRDDLHTMKGLKTRTHRSSICVADEQVLMNLLPVKSIADELLQIYLRRFETTHRVLHIPAFLEEYNSYWDNPQEMPTTFVVQLLLVMATALSLRQDIYIDSVYKGLAHGLAVRWIEASGDWLLATYAQAPPESWTILTIHCLLLIAKRANFVHTSHFWTLTGNLVRLSMAAGYHRESPHVAQISLFHQEMRRRLWATIIEMDLQASIERGMPPTIKGDDFDIHPPLNVDDNALEASLKELPAPNPLQTLTNTSFQVILRRSLKLRLKVCAWINSVHNERQFDQALQMDEELSRALRDIPTWNDTRGDIEQTQIIIYVRTTLTLCLRQYIILLHMPFARQAPHHLKFGYSRRVRLESATFVLSHYRILVDKSILPRSACRDGLVLAALTICHELYMNDEGYSSPTVLQAMPVFSESFITMAESALRILEDRVTVKAKGLSEYYVLSMVIGLVKSKLWPTSSSVSGNEAVDRVTRMSTRLYSIRTVLEADSSYRESKKTLPRNDPNETPVSWLSQDIDQTLSSVMLDDLDFLRDDLDFNMFDI